MGRKYTKRNKNTEQTKFKTKHIKEENKHKTNI